MSSRAGLAVIIGVVALYLGGFGFLSGMMVERMRFDGQRTAVLARLTSAHARLHGYLMDLERRTQTRPLASER
jgi:hypothetical protein